MELARERLKYEDLNEEEKEQSTLKYTDEE